MRNVRVERTVAAPRSSVWAVLADYPNIVDWNDGVAGFNLTKQLDCGDNIAVYEPLPDRVRATGNVVASYFRSDATFELYVAPGFEDDVLIG